MRYNIVDYINLDFLGPVHISDIVNYVFFIYIYIYIHTHTHTHTYTYTFKKTASASIKGALNMPIK